MKWEDRAEAKKANIGERLVDEYLIRNGIVPYRPIVSRRHPFDRLCASADKKRIYVAEVKSKPRRERYPDTGFNQTAFEDYMNIATAHNMDIFVYFVDEVMMEIYGGELFKNLNLKREIVHEGKLLHYPWRQGKIIYFPLCAMEHIANLSEDECLELSALRRTDYVP